MIDRCWIEPGCCRSARWWTARPDIAILQLIDSLVMHTTLWQGKQRLRGQRSVWGLTVLQLFVIALVFQEVLDRALLWLNHWGLFAIDHFLDNLGAILDWPATRRVKTDYFRGCIAVFLFDIVYVLIIARSTHSTCVIAFIKLHGQFSSKSRLSSIGTCSWIWITF